MIGFAVDELWETIRNRFGPVLSLGEGSETVWLIKDAYRHWNEGPTGDIWQWSQRGYQLMMTLVREMEKQCSKGDVAEQARRRIEQHFRQPINIKGLAADLGVSREHLSRCFRDSFDEGAAAYLRSLRLELARELQASTRLSIGEIARRSGFENGRNLARWLS